MEKYNSIFAKSWNSRDFKAPKNCQNPNSLTMQKI